VEFTATQRNAQLAFDPARARDLPTGDVRASDTGLSGLIRLATRPRELIAIITDFYKSRVAWAALIISTIILAYVGGAVMFWFHAIYLGEGGPAISNWLHWLLDSSAGFIGLGPAIAIILPIAVWASTPSTDPEPSASATEASKSRAFRPAIFALVGGFLFAVVTGPGPFMHNALVGRGTYLAQVVTYWWGSGQQPLVRTATPVSVPVELGRQILVAIPTYILLMAVALICVRAFMKISKVRSG